MKNLVVNALGIPGVFFAQAQMPSVKGAEIIVWITCFAIIAMLLNNTLPLIDRLRGKPSPSELKEIFKNDLNAALTVLKADLESQFSAQLGQQKQTLDTFIEETKESRKWAAKSRKEIHADIQKWARETTRQAEAIKNLERKEILKS